jgi:hypothetical protein
MKQIYDPGNHWHKDCMPYEEPRPGITEPDYDEHQWNPGDLGDNLECEDVPF